MKKSNTILLTVLGLAAAAVIVGISSARLYCDKNGCFNEKIFVSATSGKTITGTGNMMTREFPVTRFNGVDISGNMDVILAQGHKDAVSITANNNIFSHLTVKTVNRDLKIHPKNVSFDTTQPVKVVITVRHLNWIGLSGDTRLHAKNIETKRLEVKSGGKSVATLSGSIKELIWSLAGQSNVTVHNKNGFDMNFEAAGKSTITASGKTHRLTLAAAGKAQMNAKSLKADIVDIRGAGNADATVNVSQLLNVMTFGKSTIKYYGNPKINRSTFGELSLTKL